MKNKIEKLAFASFFIMCFGLMPIASAGDYVTYGNVVASFQAYLNGGIAITFNTQQDLVTEPLPAVLTDPYGRINPANPACNGKTYRYEDAHGIYTQSLMSEGDLAMLCGLMGITYDPQFLNQECKDMMDRFYSVFILNGQQLDISRTAYKRTFILELYGTEALWWNSEGALYKPRELARGTYYLQTIIYCDLPIGITVPLGYYAITFYIV